MIALDDLDRESPPPKKSSKMSEISTPTRQLRNKETTENNEEGTEKSKDSISEKPIEADEALEILLVEEKHSSTSNSKPVIQSGFDDQLERNHLPEYTDQLIAINEMNGAWVINYRRSSWFRVSKADDKC